MWLCCEPVGLHTTLQRKRAIGLARQVANHAIEQAGSGRRRKTAIDQ